MGDRGHSTNHVALANLRSKLNSETENGFLPLKYTPRSKDSICAPRDTIFTCERPAFFLDRSPMRKKSSSISYLGEKIDCSGASICRTSFTVLDLDSGLKLQMVVSIQDTNEL